MKGERERVCAFPFSVFFTLEKQGNKKKSDESL